MARAIVRFSLNDDDQSRVTNTARAVLEDAGFTRIGTASYDADGLGQSDLVAALGETLRVLLELPEGVTRDHVWVYVDAPG